MSIRQPLMWATVLYIIGILLGNALPGNLFIYALWASAGLLLAATLIRRKTPVTDALLFTFWMTLGIARIGMHREMPGVNPYYQTVCRKAQQERERLTDRLQEGGLEDEALSVSAALLLGQKNELDRQTRKNYAQAGASHLLALSGMHLGIIYGIIYTLFVVRIRYSEWKWFSLPLVLLVIWGYAFIAGMPTSLVRAGVMLSLVTVASLAQSDTPPLHILALSALIILLFSPDELFSISFQLSFLAVFFIVVLYQPLKRTIHTHNIILNLFLLSLIAQLGTAPLSIYYFHTLPLMGAVVSVVLIPLTTIIIYLGLLTLLLPISPFVWLLSTAVTAQNWIVKTAADCSYTTITNLYPTWWQVFLVYLLLLCIIARSHIRWNMEDFSR